MRKYQDLEIVDNILQGYLWRGQSAEQLTDAIGRPAAIDNQLLKTKKKEVWKYGTRGANRYSLRVTLEDDVVVGWDKKT